MKLLFLLAVVSLGLVSATEEEKVRCVNLTPYEGLLNQIIDMIPGRAIQDALPLPIKVNDGGEAFRFIVDVPLLCNMDVIVSNLVIQVANINFENIGVEVIDRESVFLTLPVSVAGTVQIGFECLLYRPKVFTQIEFGATFTPKTDVCIDILGLGNLPNILNFTYATVTDINYKVDAQNLYWCIYDALPLLESIIDGIIRDNVDKIWAGINNALVNTVLPGATKAINSVLRAIGIQPYNQTMTDDVFQLPKMVKEEPTKVINTISYIQTSNFSGLIYNDKGTGAWMDASFFRPISSRPGFQPLGDWGQRNYNAANGVAIMVLDDGGIMVQKPVDYQRVWESRILFADYDGSFWRPIPPAGYVALGHVAQRGYDKPSTDIIRVIREDCVVRCDPWLLWTDRCGNAKDDVGTWSIAQTTSTPIPGTFVSVPNYERPTNDMLYCLKPSCLVPFN